MKRRRLPTEQWWMKLRPLLRILAKHETVYVSEVLKEEPNDGDEEGGGAIDELLENDQLIHQLEHVQLNHHSPQSH